MKEFGKLPEFIDLEAVKSQNQLPQNPEIEIEEGIEEPLFDFESIQSSLPENESKAFYIRLMALGAFSLFIPLCLLLLVAVVAYFLLSVVFFRKSTFINDRTNAAWKFLKKMVVFSLGSFVMIFNLSFGVAIVLVYLMLKGEELNSTFYQRFYKKS